MVEPPQPARDGLVDEIRKGIDSGPRSDTTFVEKVDASDLRSYDEAAKAEVTDEDVRPASQQKVRHA